MPTTSVGMAPNRYRENETALESRLWFRNASEWLTTDYWQLAADNFPSSDVVEENWWNRPCGGREVLQLAVPLIVSTASWMVMNFIDRTLLGWHSEVEMAAAMPAGMVHFAMVCFPMGIAAYANTFVAQYHGAKRYDRISASVWQGIRVGFYCMPFYLVVIPIAPWIFLHLAKHSPLLAWQEVRFLQVVSLGAGAEIMAPAMSAFFTGRGRTRVVMVVDASAYILNGFLAWLWIFGHAGHPALGIEGSAWATVVSLWYRFSVYAILLSLPRYRSFGFWQARRYDPALLRRFLRFGGPSGLQFFVEIVGFTMFLLLVGRLGETAMAATTLAFTINNLAFMPPMGLGIALSTIVGRELGRNNPPLAARATWTSLSMVMCYMGVVAMVYVAFPNVLFTALAAGTSPGETDKFMHLRDLTIVLLRFIAAYSIFDAMNITFCSVLKGAGDTRFIMLNSFILTPILLVVTWVGICQFHFGLYWCWTIITGWVCALGTIYCGRFLFGRWRDIRVIERCERELAEEAEA